MSKFSHSRFTRRQGPLLAVLLATCMGSALAQDAGRAAPLEALPIAPRGTPCPHPVALTLTSPASQTTQYAADFPTTLNVAGAVFNQTQTNKHFGHTFQFKPPEGKCCQANPGVLTVTYKALSNGSSHKSTDAGNDGGGPVRNGVALNNMQPGGYNYIWPANGVTAGQTTVKTYSIPASWVASGRVSLMAQDDTAVVKAVLQVSGCCVTPTQAEN